MYINNFDNFLLEYSRNDKIPELTWNKKRKTGIFLFGPPGIGKTTFINNNLMPFLKNYKIFNSDELIQKLKKIGKKLIEEDEIDQKLIDNKKILQLLKDKYRIYVTLSDDDIINILKGNEFIENEKILKNKIRKYIENSNADFILDSTGNNPDKIKNIVDIAKNNKYEIIFIKIYNDLETTIKQNLNRERKVELSYQFQSYMNANKNITELKKLKPDNFYIYNVLKNKIIETTKYIDFINPSPNIFEYLGIDVKDNINYHGKNLKSCHIKKIRHITKYYFQFKEDYDKFVLGLSEYSNNLNIKNINKDRLANYWNNGLEISKKQYR